MKDEIREEFGSGRNTLIKLQEIVDLLTTKLSKVKSQTHHLGSVSHRKFYAVASTIINIPDILAARLKINMYRTNSITKFLRWNFP